MLRYYMYVYLWGAAITAYVGFLKLHFEEMDDRVFPAFEPADSGGEQTIESARSRVKRQLLEKTSKSNDPLIKKVEEFKRVLQTMKLRKLQHLSPSESKVKLTRRQNASPFQEPRNKTVEEETRKTGKRKKRQTEEKMSMERKMKEKLRRAKRDETAENVLRKAHANSDQSDLYRGDPNEFFDEEKQELEDNQVQEGVAKQLFVVHWMRTLAYFIFLQLLIFFILFFAFWSYGYYRYEVWKAKVDGFYGNLIQWFQSFNQAESGMTEKTEKVNIDMEEAMEKHQDDEDKRQDAIGRMMEKRDLQEALQKTAYENVQKIKKEREKRQKAAEEKEKKREESKPKGKKTDKSKDSHNKSTKKADGTRSKSKSHKRQPHAGEADDEAKQGTDHPAAVHPEPGTEMAQQMTPMNYYYPGYDPAYYAGYHHY